MIFRILSLCSLLDQELHFYLYLNKMRHIRYIAALFNMPNQLSVFQHMMLSDLKNFYTGNGIIIIIYFIVNGVDQGFIFVSL